MIKLIAPQREGDSFGCGYYGASRGDRNHNGVDHACSPKSLIFAPVSGEVTKIGYPYSDDLSFKYVQITTKQQYNVRVFYVDPDVKVGELITKDTIIGSSQKLGDRYKGITEHVHLEVKNLLGEHINPSDINL